MSDTSIGTCSSLIDPALVSVVGVVEDQGMVPFPGSKVSKDKKKLTSPDDNKSDTSISAKSSSDKPFKSSSGSRLAKSADVKIDALEKKWLEKFNRLEALLIARSL